MSWKATELDALLPRDFDDIVERGRTLSGRGRIAALRDSLARLEMSGEPLDRLKIVLFVQTLLAFVPDGKLASSGAESAANILSNVVISALDPDELKRSALSALALLVLKATELTTSAKARMRAAFIAVRDSSDPEIRDFARRKLPTNSLHPRSSGTARRRPKLLLIHGRDELNLQRLKTLLRVLRCEIMVLDYQPARGRTIIEMLEQAMNGADFVMAMLTPDDLVELDGKSYRQARSNVYFELGWAYAMLGRSRAFVLLKRGTHLPDDLSGINRIDFAENVLEVAIQLQTALESAGVLIPAKVAKSA